MSKMVKSPSIFGIMAVIFTNILGAGMILPILPLYATENFGASVFQAALLSTAFFAAQFIAAPVLGRLSDRFGRRPVLMVSQLGTTLSFILFLFADQIGVWLDSIGLGNSAMTVGLGGGLFMLFFARSLDGITGGNITTAQAYISDITTEEERTQSLGMLSAARGTGFILGPAVGGMLSGINVHAPFIAAVVITFATFLLTFFILGESLPPEKRESEDQPAPAFSIRDTLTNPNLFLLILLGFLAISAFSALPPTFTLYVDRVIFPEISEAGLVAQRVGFMLMFSGVFSVFTQLVLLKRLVKRFGEKRLVLVGFTVWGLGMVAFPLVDNVFWLTGMLAPYAFSRGVIDPSLQSLVTRFSTEKNRGRVLGIYQSGQSLAFIMGPIWAGYVFEAVSPKSVFWFAAGFLFVGWLFALRLQGVSKDSKMPDKA